jgi:hypothetical protein
LFKRTFAFKNSKGKESVSFPYSYQTRYWNASPGFEDDSMDELIATLKGNETVHFVASPQVMI